MAGENKNIENGSLVWFVLIVLAIIVANTGLYLVQYQMKKRKWRKWQQQQTGGGVFTANGLPNMGGGSGGVVATLPVVTSDQPGLSNGFTGAAGVPVVNPANGFAVGEMYPGLYD